ncbi:MAG TPA: YihY/virulence factor BrkB family protein [Longimicrobiales bacterium]
MTPAGRFSFGHARAEAGDFIRRVWNKADQDQIFFMAGAIAFNVLIAIVPLVLAALGITGLILRNSYPGAPTVVLEQAIRQALPAVSTDFINGILNPLNDIIDNSKSVTVLGITAFVWFATRLVGTLRTALREIFDLQHERSIIAGKIFDVQMVVVAGALLALSVSITVILEYIAARSRAVLDVHVSNINFWQTLYLNSFAFVSIWVMFLLIYRYLPIRRIHWRTALISTTFTSVIFEMLKRLFGLYVKSANIGALYTSLSVAAIVVIWVYYASVAFILGGEVGQVWTLRRIRRRQKERLG